MSNRGINWAKSVEGSVGYKSVLSAMADTANQYMATWASRKTLAKATGLKEDTVRDHQNKAVKRGDLVLVPWQTENGADASPGFFLGCVHQVFDELPPLDVAFEKRINFKGPGRGGSPRGFKPSWWSGERSTDGHRCTACGGVCHGDESPRKPPANTDPGEGRREEVAEGYAEPLPEALSDPGEGGVSPTLEGGCSPTLPGGRFSDPFNPKESNPKEVSQKSYARADARASSATPSGLPAGRDGLRPRGFAAPEGDAHGDEQTTDQTALAEELDRQRHNILAMDRALLTESMANLERNFPDLHRRSYTHASRRGLACDQDAFDREALWFAVQEDLRQRMVAAA